MNPEKEEVQEETEDQTPNDSPVLQAARAEFLDRTNRSMELSKLIEEARTATKKRFYHKKLARNNEEAIRLLIAIERISKQRSTRAAEL